MHELQQTECLADGGRLQDFVRALLIPPYAAALFFPAGRKHALSSIFPPSPMAEKVARHMRLREDRMPCREMAIRFPGLFSTMDARQACQCPLKEVCGHIRVDTIRLESHGQRLGELMLFAWGSSPSTSWESAQTTAHAQALADQLWNLLRVQQGGGGA